MDHALDGDLDVDLDQGLGDGVRGQLQLDDAQVAFGPRAVVHQEDVRALDGKGFLDGLGLQQDGALLRNLALET